MMVAEFAREGISLGHQKALDLASRVMGYINLSEASTAEPQVVPLLPKLDSVESEESQKTQLVEALDWACNRLEAVLASKPVRDADECLSHARKLMAYRSTLDLGETALEFRDRMTNQAIFAQNVGTPSLHCSGGAPGK